MALRWVVWLAGGELLGYWPTRQAVTSRARQGWYVPGAEGRLAPGFDLPDGYTVEPEAVGQLTAVQQQAVAYLAVHADGGCPVCVSRQIELTATIWPEVEWPAVISTGEGRHG